MQDFHGNAAHSHMMYDANRKSVGAAYLLLIFLGGFSAHRFYLGRTGTAVTQLLFSIFGWFLTFTIGIGIFLLIALWIWLFVDLFLIPSIAREENMRLANHLAGGGYGASFR